MADDVILSEVRARGFDVVRRGYDRVEVDRYLSVLADEIERLRGKLEDRTAKELKVGLDDPEALALELGAIGGEVSSILEAARNAADGMRSRAASDVESWRTTAEQETRAIISETTEQSQSMRAAAWNEGTSMLSSSLAESKALVDAAKEDALFIRAGAEREAIRLTGDAKRDREESIRSARMEADQLRDSARSESDGILAAAGKQAEQAQERARALEDRRAELLAELESARASIGHLEEEIESRRLELETPMVVLETEDESRTHRDPGSGSVKIVAPSKSVILKPVDAEEVVADVVALRTGRIVEAESDTVATEPKTVTVIAPPPQPTTDDGRLTTHDDAEPELVGEDSAVVPTGVERKPSAGDDHIGSLFASLRDDARESESTDASSLQGGQASSRARGAREPASPEGLDVEEPTEPEPASPQESDSDELPALVPFQNAALKDIKRTLVDLQNDALEHLRTDVDWSPRKSFTNKFASPFRELAVGVSGSKEDGGAAKDFGNDLHLAVTGVLTNARESGAGDRQVSSSVSRVFRMWRADEAERRVVDAAQQLSSRS